MTADTFALARQSLLAAAGLGEDDLQRTLSCLLDHAIDGGDLYFQLRRAESWSLEDGQVKGANHAIQQGVGVRAISGEKTGFAYSDEIVLPALLEAATAARAIARHGGDGRLQVWRAAGRPARHKAEVSSLPRIGSMDPILPHTEPDPASAPREALLAELQASVLTVA